MYLDIVEGATEMTQPGLRNFLKSEAPLGCNALTREGRDIGHGQASRRWRMDDAVLEDNPEIRRGDLRERDAMVSHCQRRAVAIKPRRGCDKLMLETFERTVEATRVRQAFITGRPVEVSPLAREGDSEPGTGDRFGLFVSGKELGNGFSELYDPGDQAARFQARVDAMAADSGEAKYFDADYIRVLKFGQPPTEGLDFGIDRHVMLFADVDSIRDVFMFPGRRVRCSDIGAPIQAGIQR
jgi:lysyl-tRNA synthetase, class II